MITRLLPTSTKCVSDIIWDDENCDIMYNYLKYKCGMKIERDYDGETHYIRFSIKPAIKHIASYIGTGKYVERAKQHLEKLQKFGTI